MPLAGKLRKELDVATPGQPYHWTELGNGLGLGARTAVEPAVAERVKEFMASYGRYVERISLRRRAPNLMAFFRLTGLEQSKSDALWRSLGELVR